MVWEEQREDAAWLRGQALKARRWLLEQPLLFLLGQFSK